MNLDSNQCKKELLYRLYHQVDKQSIDLVVDEMFNLINELLTYHIEQERLINENDSILPN